MTFGADPEEVDDCDDTEQEQDDALHTPNNEGNEPETLAIDGNAVRPP